MHALDIQYALKKAGITQADIARQCQVSKVTVGYVIAGKTTSRHVAKAISAATGCSLETLWPGKYAPEETVAASPVALGDAA